MENTALRSSVLEVCQALEDEILAIQRDRGQRFEVRNGQWVYGTEEGCLYTFEAEVAFQIPTETPIQLRIDEDGVTTKGQIVDLKDFEVLIQVSENLGQLVPRAMVSSEPWFIYDSFKERLTKTLEEPIKDLTVPKFLLGQTESIHSPIFESEVSPSGSLLGDKASLLPLNKAQNLAVSRCVNSHLHFVWGPPGTGKTVTLAKTVEALVSKGERVLVLAHSNVAVDMAMVRIADTLEGSELITRGEVLRIGVPHLSEILNRRDILPEGILERQNPDLVGLRRDLVSRRENISKQFQHAPANDARTELGRELKAVSKQLNKINKDIRSHTKSLVQKAKIVGATLSRLAIDENAWCWPADAILIDETSMAAFPAVLAASLKGSKRLLLFGDFRQLPPICLAKTIFAKNWLARDAFEIAGVRTRLEQDNPEPRATLLEIQYRMAPPIADIVNRLAYEGRLKNGPGLDERESEFLNMGPWKGSSLVFINTSGLIPACFQEPQLGSYSRANPIHAALGISIGLQIIQEGCSSLAIITPYRAQARLLSKFTQQLLPLNDEVIAATIHRFQGSERDVVVFDLVDAPPENAASNLTGRDEDTSLRLMNVAFSRARGKLLILANADSIWEWHPSRSPARRVLQMLYEGRNVVHLTPATLPWSNVADNLSWIENWSELEKELCHELRQVKESLVINFPAEFSPSSFLRDSLNSIPGELKSFIIFVPYPIAQLLEESKAEIRLLSRPGGFFALLDHRIAYFSGNISCGVVVRVEDETIVKTLEELYLGSALSGPQPRAEIEAAVSRICGCCPECGEVRRLRKGMDSSWTIQCDESGHPSIPLDAVLLNSLVSIMEILCPGCQSRPSAYSRGQNFFLRCVNYNHGCRSRMPTLQELFGAYL